MAVRNHAAACVRDAHPVGNRDADRIVRNDRTVSVTEEPSATFIFSEDISMARSLTVPVAGAAPAPWCAGVISKSQLTMSSATEIVSLV